VAKCLIISRAVIVALAVATAAWFILGARQARDTARATSIISASSSLSKTQAQRAMSFISAAGELNPDSGVDLLRAQVEAERGRRQAAVRILVGLTLREPDNAVIWDQLAHAATNARVVAHALRQLAELTSPVGKWPSGG
jgi:predicted Zn-dependent protease